MHRFRLLVALALAVSLPATALASVMRADHCAARAPVVSEAGMSAHAGHDMAAIDSAEHSMPVDGAEPLAAEMEGCDCGCLCGDARCAGSTAGMAATPERVVTAVSPGDAVIVARPSWPASAHPLPLIRPPSPT